jgi:hypothetical protein
MVSLRYLRNFTRTDSQKQVIDPAHHQQQGQSESEPALVEAVILENILAYNSAEVDSLEHAIEILKNILPQVLARSKEAILAQTSSINVSQNILELIR